MDIFGVEVPFADQCGIEAVSYQEGVSRLRLNAGPAVGNNIGAIHGGAIATLLDIALASAARCAAGAPVATVNLQLNYLSPARGDLLGEGRVVKLGRSLIFVEGAVRDGEGVVVATATGVMKPVRVSA